MRNLTNIILGDTLTTAGVYPLKSYKLKSMQKKKSYSSKDELDYTAGLKLACYQHRAPVTVARATFLMQATKQIWKLQPPTKRSSLIGLSKRQAFNQQSYISTMKQ